MYLSSAWFGTCFRSFWMSGSRIGLVFLILEWVLMFVEVRIVFVDVSRSLARICYRDVSRGLDSFDILRCLEVRI